MNTDHKSRIEKIKKLGIQQSLIEEQNRSVWKVKNWLDEMSLESCDIKRSIQILEKISLELSFLKCIKQEIEELRNVNM